MISVPFLRSLIVRNHHDRDRMVVRFTTTCAISSYHHEGWEFEFRSWRGIGDTTLCDTIY